MSKRYKPVGWRGEPHRHYLAAKGIKTRYNAGKYGDKMWAHKPGHFYNEEDIPDTADKFVDSEGNILAYQDKMSGEADAVSDEMLRKAEKEGGIRLEEGRSEMMDGMEMKTDASEKMMTVPKNPVLEDVPDLKEDVQQDMDFNQGFKLSDAAVMPGSLVKDAGNAIGDMVRFASDVTKK